MKQRKELDVLKQVQDELKRFQSKLDDVISESSKNNVKSSQYKNQHYKTAGLKRAAIDLKQMLSKITTSTGTNGIYYYNNE